MTKIGSSKPLPTSELEILNKALLHLYHRNKNQHHRSHWWKHVNIFRRQLRILSTELCFEQTDSVNPSSESRLKHPLTLNSKGQRRLEAWTEFYVMQWYRAFSQILAERRFASIGLVLLAILAKASALFGVTQALIDQGQHELTDAMKDIEAASIEKHLHGIIDKTKDVLDEDVGEVVQRDLSELQIKTLGPPDGLTALSRASDYLGLVKTSSTKVNKKKRSNAIDDLFDSLG